MAVNWSAYDAAKELYNGSVENMQDIGSRFPLFSRAVMQVNGDTLLDILGAIPKVTARVMETGLKALVDGDEPAEEKAEKEEVKETKKTEKKTATKAKKKETEDENEDDEPSDYSKMKASDLYSLCCERGLSGKCKERNKAYLIKVLEEADAGNSAEDEDDWGDEEDETKDPYKGKTAVELFKMCKSRGISTKPKLKAEKYVELLKKADAAEAENEPEDDDDDEWEI